MTEQRNIHGVKYRTLGTYLFIHRTDGKPGSCCLIKQVDVDTITADIANGDFEGFREGRCFFSKVNKHGVEFVIEGARFSLDGVEYEIGLPYMTDITHIYTPLMLMRIMREHGSYSNKSQLWKRVEIKPAEPLYIHSLE